MGIGTHKNERDWVGAHDTKVKGQGPTAVEDFQDDGQQFANAHRSRNRKLLRRAQRNSLGYPRDLLNSTGAERQSTEDEEHEKMQRAKRRDTEKVEDDQQGESEAERLCEKKQN